MVVSNLNDRFGPSPNNIGTGDDDLMLVVDARTWTTRLALADKEHWGVEVDFVVDGLDGPQRRCVFIPLWTALWLAEEIQRRAGKAQSDA